MNTRKNRWYAWTLASVAMVGMSACPLAIRPAHADAGGNVHQYVDRNPRIHRALDALHDAKDELTQSHRDFRGKKADAMDAIDRAIEKLDEIKDIED